MSMPILQNITPPSTFNFTFKTPLTVASDFNTARKKVEEISEVDKDTIQTYDFGFNQQAQTITVVVEMVRETHKNDLLDEFYDKSPYSLYKFINHTGKEYNNCEWKELQIKHQKTTKIDVYYTITMIFSPYLNE